MALMSSLPGGGQRRKVVDRAVACGLAHPALRYRLLFVYTCTATLH